MPRIGHLDNVVADFEKDIKSSVADNAKAVYDIKNEVTNTIVEQIKPTSDKINSMDGSIQDVNKALAVFEGRHVETVEKMKEVTLLSNNTQIQMKDHEQKMIEQSANGLNDIREQLLDIVNRNNASSQEIEAVKKQTDNLASHLEEQLANFEDVMDKKINSDIMPRIGQLDKVNQNLVEQLLGFETDFEGKFKKQEEKDDALLKKINGMDDQVHTLSNTVSVFESHRTETLEKFKEVNVITNTIQTQIREQEQKMLQQNSNGLNQIREQLENIESRTSVSSQEIEKGKKQTENLSRHLDAQLAIFEDVMDKKINTDIMPRIGHLDDVVADLEKDIKSSLADNAKAVYDIKNEVTNTIVEQIKPTSDKINSMDGSIQDVNKALAVFEGRHVETVEKMKEVTLLSNNTQIQMKDHEQKMIEQSANGLNDIREQLLDIVNRNNASSQEIEAVKKQTDNLASHLEEQLANFEDVMDKKINSDIMPRIGQLDKVNQNLVEQLLG